MALTLSEIQAVTDDVWLPGAQDNWAEGNVWLMKLLGMKETIPSCEKVRAVLEYNRSRGGAFGPTTIFDTAKKDIINAARFDWAYFWSGLTVDIKDMTQASGGNAELDLILTKLNNAQKSVKDYMGDSIYLSYSDGQTEWGADAIPFYGIPDLMNQGGTTSYGGIQPDDLLGPDSTSVWLAFQDATALTMNFDTMQVLRRGCAVGNEAGDKPDFYVTTETLKDAFENTLQAQQRYYDKGLAQAGFENVKFGARGVVVADDKAASGYVYGFNMNFIKFKVHQDYNFTRPEWKEPTNQAVKTAQMLVACCFLTSQRRAHGQLTNVS
jgi:hypothetical protein